MRDRQPIHFRASAKRLREEDDDGTSSSSSAPRQSIAAHPNFSTLMEKHITPWWLARHRWLPKSIFTPGDEGEMQTLPKPSADVIFTWLATFYSLQVKPTAITTVFSVEPPTQTWSVTHPRRKEINIREVYDVALLDNKDILNESNMKQALKHFNILNSNYTYDQFQHHTFDNTNTKKTWNLSSTFRTDNANHWLFNLDQRKAVTIVHLGIWYDVYAHDEHEATSITYPRNDTRVCRFGGLIELISNVQLFFTTMTLTIGLRTDLHRIRFPLTFTYFQRKMIQLLVKQSESASYNTYRLLTLKFDGYNHALDDATNLEAIATMTNPIELQPETLATTISSTTVQMYFGSFFTLIADYCTNGTLRARYNFKVERDASTRAITIVMVQVRLWRSNT